MMSGIKAPNPEVSSGWTISNISFLEVGQRSALEATIPSLSIPRRVQYSSPDHNAPKPNSTIFSINS